MPADQKVYSLHPYRDAGGKWRWSLKARNGRIVADGSEAYSSRSAVVASLKRICAARLVVAGSDVDHHYAQSAQPDVCGVSGTSGPAEEPAPNWRAARR